jgi:peptidoglycan/LPS O-acetylase OafA/YrhL
MTDLRRKDRTAPWRANLFFLLILLTVIITRLSIALVPEVDLRLFGLIIHHFWFGALFFLIGFFCPKKLKWLKVGSVGIGLGLMLDQLVFLLLGGGKDQEYWNRASVLGTTVLTLGLYPFRKKLLSLLVRGE